MASSLAYLTGTYQHMGSRFTQVGDEELGSLDLLSFGANTIGAPLWLTGLLVDGVYLATAWVISVMLPPMAIFFPMFTLLEDFGYLPRVAFNLDRFFKASGAHGKQAMTTMMGFGCNAAGVVATRIIDSPRERLLAIQETHFTSNVGGGAKIRLAGPLRVRLD